MFNLSNDTKAGIVNYLWLVLFIAALCFTIRALVADAGPPVPSRSDLQNLEDIKQNQASIQQLKEWNKAEVAELNKNGWNVDWSTMELVPLELAL